MEDKKFKGLLTEYKNQKINLPTNFSQEVMFKISQRQEKRLIFKISLVLIATLFLGIFLSSLQSLWQGMTEYGTIYFVRNFISELSFYEFFITFTNFIPWLSFLFTLLSISFLIIIAIFYWKIIKNSHVNGFNHN
jgi:hypothetical protein